MSSLAQPRPQTFEKRIETEFERQRKIHTNLQGRELERVVIAALAESNNLSESSVSQQPIVEKQLKVTFVGTLNDFAQEKATVFTLPIESSDVFCKSIEKIDGTEIHGNPNNVLLVAASVNQKRSTLPVDTCISLDSLKIENNFVTKDGVKAAIFVPSGISPSTKEEKIYEINVEKISPSILRAQAHNEQTLRGHCRHFDDEGDRLVVKEKSPIVKAIKLAAEQSPEVREAVKGFPTYMGQAIIPSNIVEDAIENILSSEAVQETSFINLSKFSAELKMDDGKPWNDIKTHPMVRNQHVSDLMKKHIENNYTYQVSCVLKLKYAFTD